jgi:hypothetical protein
MANKSEKSDKNDKAKSAKAAPKKAAPAAKPEAKAPKAKPAAAKPEAAKPDARAPKAKPAAAKPEARAPKKGPKAKPVADVATVEALAPVETSPEMAPIEAAGDLGDLMMEDAMLDGTAPEPPLTPEEQELAAIYGEDLKPAPAAAAHAEFSDSRSADEDRPMMPEINGRQERQKRWEERRDQRRARRDFERGRRQDHRGGGGGGAVAVAGASAPAERPRDERPREDRPRDERPREDRPRDERSRDNGGGRFRDNGGDRPQLALPAMAAPVLPADASGVVRVGNAQGDAAWQVFASIRGAQPMPVKQLASMMRKRGLFEGDPDQNWPHLKAALLGDERSYRALGLRPRIVYRGRDLFAPGDVAQSATAEAESELARALSTMAVATHTTLKARLGQANQGGFERLVHAYLIAVGYQDINWIKRTDDISYATAIAPGASGTILISARSGDAPVDRRGVGELRVGVEAKGLLAGHLFAARELSSDAERELERPGRSIAVYAGDGFVTALITAGVGVVTAAAPIRYVDDQLFGELLAG